MIQTVQELRFDSKVMYDEGYVEGNILLLYLDVIWWYWQIYGCFPSSRKSETFTMHLRTRSGTSSELAFWNMHLGGFLCEKIPLIRHHARMSQKLRKSRKFLSKTSLQCPKLDWKLVEHTVTLARLQAVENRHSGANNFRFFKEGSRSLRLLLKFGSCLLKMDGFTTVYHGLPLPTAFVRNEGITLAGYLRENL